MSETQPKIAVILSGCGVYDGAEIHESVLTLLALDRAAASYQCFAPDVDQHHVVNHLSGEEMAETRNVLTESARIARGEIKPLSDFDASAFDGIIFPGGFGAAKNLSSFAFDGADCSVNADVQSTVEATVKAGKPIAALCIVPAVMAKVLEGCTVTIGQDDATAGAIETMGATHTKTLHGGVVRDDRYKLVTAPCYMLESSISQIADGATNAVAELMAMVAETKAAA